MSVNGDVNDTRAILQDKKVQKWSPLEDMALQEPETSNQFKVLLAQKGWESIALRRQFLQAKPVFESKNPE